MGVESLGNVSERYNPTQSLSDMIEQDEVWIRDEEDVSLSKKREILSFRGPRQRPQQRLKPDKSMCNCKNIN